VNIKIGIVGNPIGWRILLQQIGVPHSTVQDTLLPEDYSVVVVSDDADDRESEMLRQYLTLGGAVLCSAKVYARIRQSTAQTINIDYCYPPQNSVFRSLGVIDISAKCQIAWNANDLKTNKGSLAAHVGIHPGDYAIALPFDPGALVLDQRSALKSFPSSERRLPFELVSCISKGEIRQLVSQSLEILCHRRGLPFFHIWSFPNGARSIFCFRIDTDYATDEQLMDLSLIIRRNGVPAAWFIDTKSHNKSLKQFAALENQEIGLHCFEHQTFETYQENLGNIHKAQSILHASNIHANGFASPYGRWNAELGRALVDAGFEYSSEFSYDYDNLPVKTQLSRSEGILQIPIHPICIGSLKHQGYTDVQMIRYFAEVIKRKLANRDSIVFYHHPKDGHHQVLDWIFQEMRRERVPVKSMYEFAQWWNMRMISIPEVEFSHGSLKIQSSIQDRSLYIRIAKADGTEAILPIAQQIVLDTVHWEAQPQAWTMPDNYLRMRRFNYRIPLQRTTDALMKVVLRITK
jgi:hypothetical protein